jgi:hypothetical protein
MNATAHMSGRVMYPPIHAAISSTLKGIEIHRKSVKPNREDTND